MAINSLDLCGDKNLNQSVYSSSSKGSNMTQCRLVKINFSSNGNITSSAKIKTGKGWSPYLAEDRVQMLSQHTEKKVYKQTEIVSSFPMAAKLYKANSAEFKLKKKKAKKNNKKSVLTLPNEPSALPQTCTVSDMNDSEYFNRDSEKGNKLKKRLPIQNKKKLQRRNQDFEFYDRDAKYCSQVNIDLDCSSTDVIRNFKGDCINKRRHCYNEMANEEEVQPHDVWAVLRNINRFQFNPSPPLSEESIILSPRRKKTVKKNKRKTPEGTSVFETCRTEQFSYISSIDVGSKSPLSPTSYSPASSIDRITVIDNQRVIQEICEKKPKVAKTRSPKVRRKAEKPANKPRCKKMPKDQFKAICSPLVNRLEGHNTNQASKSSLNKDSLVPSSTTKESRTSHEFDGSFNNDDGSLRDVPCNNITTEIECLSSSRSNLSFNCKKEKDKVSKSQHVESHPRMTGPTRVELSKGQELAMLRRQGLTMRKPRLVTTMPSSVPIPKSTQTDIRRRLANIKFPIVILGKDQVSATFEVEPNNYSQFNGLDEHIWPFMLAWSADLQNPEIRDGKHSARRRNSVLDRSKRYEDTTVTVVKKPTNYLALNKQALKAKKPIVADVNNSITKKKDPKQIPVNQENNVEPQQIVKPKPIRQLRDKMLRLLYKKTSSQSVVTETPRACVQGESKVVIPTKDKKCKNAATYVNVEETIVPHQMPAAAKEKTIVRQVTMPVLTSKQARPTSPSKLLTTPSTPPRGKAKWASAFIDNVIKKIKSGVYYNHDFNEMDKQNIDRNDAKEVSIQTSLPSKSIGITQAFEDLTPKITIHKKKEAYGFLPGFDEELPPLEIKSMTRHQIAVKHCVTNVMLQFDVCVPVEHDPAVANFKRSMSCIPLSVTESKTKVFKCKARLVNAMLPAEICSLIPKVMSKLAKSDAKLALPLVQESDVNNCLSTISELSTFENLETKLPFLPHIKMSLELIKLAGGEFPKKLKDTPEKPVKERNVISMIKTEFPLVMKFIPKPWIDIQYYFVPRLVHAVSFTSAKCTPTQISNPRIKISTPQEANYCTDLLPYSPKETNLRLPQTMLIKFLNHLQVGLLTNSVSNLNTVQLSSFLNNTLTVNLKVGNVQEISNTVSINVVNLRIDSIYNALDKIVSSKSTTDNSVSAKCIEYIKNVDQTKVKESGNETPLPNITVCKRRKRKYVKLYKKCKSTSHISAEKKSTSLSKITNLDEFFLALGAGKMLSSAFDGYGGRKILSSIIELKSWITDITPRQALLVMLLTNKKDTPNLVRFRPVILQGIAVNRITRASELDMEIEVIERESFIKRSEHEGIPSSFNCVQNNDSLLEELFWIAKTTASDYQRPFDESSEKLLKALLEKRKKLNPSYLRVMARYVGLGLLKSPAKN